MFTIFRRRRRPGTMPSRRFFRPLVEGLESRDLLAINTTISTNATSNVNTVVANNTTTFTATATGANINIADIDTALAGGKNVMVTSGAGAAGVQNGTISTSGLTTFNFNNASGTSLTIQSGTGFFSDQADITLTGLQLTKFGTLIIDANDTVNLSGELTAGTMTITAGGSISMPSGGELFAATLLSLTAGGDIGTSANHVLTDVNQLTTNTSANNTDQFITEANSLAALNLNAGTGDITLIVTAGAVSDIDAATDITADLADITLSDATARNFGATANPIGTSVNSLIVQTNDGGGSQFIAEADGLSQLLLASVPGNVTLVVSAGAITDTDNSSDIVAGIATVTLSDSTPHDLGSAGNPIGTNVSSQPVDSLLIDTSAGGGSMFINEINTVGGLALNAGTGNVTLIATFGTISDSDPDTDITADIANILLNDTTAKNLGSSVHPIQTAVNGLTATTAAGNGSQFLEESNGLTALNLRAGTGNVTLTAKSGSLTDTDPTLDIVATAATVTLSDSTAKDFGVMANPIHTSVDSLSVNISAGDGSQYITEFDGLTALHLDADNGFVDLIVSAGAVFDGDTAPDITAHKFDIELRDTTAKDFGTVGEPIGVSVNLLNVLTLDGDGSQFITESNGLSGFQLLAGEGNVTLTAAAGAVLTAGALNKISAATATVTLSDPTTKDFGSTSNPVHTVVSNLSVITAAGGGNQFISEANSTTITTLDAGAGNITLVSGTFNLAAGNAVGDLSTLVVNSPAILNLASGDETINTLVGNGTVNFNADHTDHSLTVGDDSGSNFAGSLTGNDDVFGPPIVDKLVKVGAGTLVLSGSSSFTGEIDVLAGTLLVNGSIDDSSVGVFVSAILGGSGTIRRPVIINSGGHLAPGASTDVLSTDKLTFNAGATFDVEITSAAADEFDQVDVAETVTIATAGAGVALNITKSGTVTLNDGDELVIIRTESIGVFGEPVSGTFKNLPEGATVGFNFLGTGLAAKISYIGGEGNDVSLKLSPGFPWHNDAEPGDVAGIIDANGKPQPDESVSIFDAQEIVNVINKFHSLQVPSNAQVGQPFGFIDVFPDGNITLLDAQEVVNIINFRHHGGGEGESLMTPQSFAADNQLSGTNNSDDWLNLLALDVAEFMVPNPKRR